MMDQPADVACPVEDVQGDGRWKSLHKHYVHLTGEREPEVLFVGDSLIQHLGQSEVWKMFERYHCLNFGVGGDQTQHVLWRLENGELQNIQPKAIVLLVGTNNHDHTADEVTKGIEAIVKLIVDKQPQAHIIVMAIPPRGHRHNKLRDKNSAINAALATSLPTLGKAELLESAKSLLSSEGLIFTSDMFDFLHFTNQGYKKLCEPLQDRLEEILSE